MIICTHLRLLTNISPSYTVLVTRASKCTILFFSKAKYTAFITRKTCVLSKLFLPVLLFKEQRADRTCSSICLSPATWWKYCWPASLSMMMISYEMEVEKKTIILHY